MSIAFNADEMLQIAEQIEKNGMKFYARAAELTSDPRCKELLAKLADAEATHLETFSKMRVQLSENRKLPSTFDPHGETAQYLTALADRHVFDLRQDLTTRLSDSATPQEILQLAIAAEKESVVLYVGLKELVPAKLGSGSVDEIIAEEMRHITLLSRQLAQFVS